MPGLIVFVPDIEYLSGGAAALPDGLRRRLQRARWVEGGADGALADALALGPLPSAAVLSRLALDPVPEPAQASTWLRFDAVGLVPDLTSVWVERPVQLDFSRAELQPLVAELGEMFAGEGLAWQPQPGLGFGILEFTSSINASFMSLNDIPGRRLDEVLPTGPDARRWCRMINESQMVFHQFRALDRVDQRSLGLWFWGAGSIPDAPVARLRIIDDSDDPRLAGLARWLDVARLTSDVSAGFERDETVLLHWPLHGGDPVDALQQLDSVWLNRARGPVELVGSRGRWQLAPADRYAFWRHGPIRGFVEDAT